MKTVIKRAARTFNAVSAMVEETAMSGTLAMDGVRSHADIWRREQIGRNHFRYARRQKKWADKAKALGIELPEVEDYKL